MRIALFSLLVGVALLALLEAWSFKVISDRAQENCVRIHRVVTGGAQVIDARRRLQAFLRSGAISRDQYDRGVKESERNLRIWMMGDCPP